jgi:tetratricopeptide (TPR) repeat protein
MQRLFLPVVMTFSLVSFALPARAKPQDADFYRKRGFDWYRKGEYDKAIADYDLAIRLDPDADVYVKRGTAWYETDEYDKAIADFDQAIKINPKHAEAYLKRGTAWDHKGEYDKAIADYDQAIKINPKDDWPYNNRAFAWKKKGAFDKAIADYEQAIKLNPTFGRHYSNLARLQATCPDQRYRDGQKAITNAKKACELDSRNWRCIDSLAAACAENGDFKMAQELETKAIEMARKDKLTAAQTVEEARERLELYKQNKPFREELKK